MVYGSWNSGWIRRSSVVYNKLRYKMCSYKSFIDFNGQKFEFFWNH